MNKTILMGRLTRDPEVRTSSGATQTTIARFSIAVDRRFKREGEPTADFFDCTAFGKLGEFVEKYLRKGTKILLEGRLQNNNYTDKDGIQRYTIRVIAETIEFAESKRAAEGGEQTAVPAPAATAPAAANATAADDFINIPDGVEDDLPFN